MSPAADYTAQDMVRSAKSRGYKSASTRLLADWVALGLLDKAGDHGLGRGKGKRYAWPQAQHDLFITLLGQRQRAPSTSRVTLTNFPVALWLIWGDSYVPLRQVRRALGTWSGRYGRVSWKQSQATAREVLDHLDHPNATDHDRMALTDAIAHAGYQGRIDSAELRPLVKRVFDPNDTGMTRGPLGLMKAEDYISTVVARTTALARLQDAPDRAYEYAREVYRRAGPLAQHPPPLPIAGHLISPRSLGAQPAVSFDAVVNRACLDLITTLGVVLVESPT